MRSRKGFELSINMIVVIVISIVLFGIGFFLITTLIGDANNQVSKIDQKLMDELRRTQFDDGKRVALLNPKEYVKRGEYEYFLLGFVNKDPSTADHDFRVMVEYSPNSPIDPTLSMSPEPDIQAVYSVIGTYVFYEKNTFTLDYNQDKFLNLAFKADKDMPSGEYFYDVVVCWNGPGTQGPCLGQGTTAIYGGKQRIFVTVH